MNAPTCLYLDGLRAGDTLHVESAIAEIRPSRSKPDRGLIALGSKTLNHDGAVCQHAVMRVQAVRRPE